jgi:hypothetical protein
MLRVFCLTRDRQLVRALTGTLLGIWIWGVQGVQGNDTGGIIPFSEMRYDDALAIAGEHCSRYDKYAVITSVHPWPGDYIGFACRRPGRWGPVEDGNGAGRRVLPPADK